MALQLKLKLKAFLISVTVLFAALGLKASLPFATTHFPYMWNLFLLCFKPPYLYIIVNAIIISILASSRFHHSISHSTDQPIPPPCQLKSPSDSTITISEAPVVIEPNAEDLPVLQVKAVVVNGSSVEQEQEQEEEEQEKAIDDGIDSTWTSLKWIDSTEIPPEYLSPTEKPLVSARFAHRKLPKSTPGAGVVGGRALRVARPKRHETLENTWKAITEGRSMPLSRHMKKCDTWQDRGNGVPPEVKKSATFKDRVYQPVSVGQKTEKLPREPSLSQDELNRRVEAFIRNFNEQMRLQRQESLNQHKQMINRGAS